MDNIGMLSRLYQYADLCYIGGGFERSGIHNTLEAAAYGKPVVFGPNYRKFNEAKELIKSGGAFSIASGDRLCNLVKELIENKNQLDASGVYAKKYVYAKRGATEKIMNYIKEKRLLTI